MFQSVHSIFPSTHPTRFTGGIPDVYNLLQKANWKPSPQEGVDFEAEILEGDQGQNLLCAFCGNLITRTSERVEVNGSHLHTFANPYGFVFRFGCFLTASGCAPSGQESTHYSWFTGYAWQILTCGRCGIHMGWMFRSEEKRFSALVLDNLVEEQQDFRR